MSKLTRRDFLVLNATSVGALSAGIAGTEALAESTPQSSPPVPPLVEVNFEALVSKSDLHYLSPVADPGEGQPIGNGRMGTLVWTTPNSLNFQINRVDVFGLNRDHRGGHFMSGMDRCGACAGVVIDVGGNPFGKSEHFHQRLSFYGAESQIQGQGVQARCFVAANTDVLVVEIDDQRPTPTPLQLTLSMWGKPREQVGDHVTTFEFVKSGDKHGVTRKFTEGDFYSCSMVAVNVSQGQLTPTGSDETTRTFQIKAGPGGKTVLHISSSASMRPKVDVVDQSFKLLQETSDTSYDALQRSHRAWWAKFWARTFISLESADGVAAFMQQVRNLHLYVMASIARGALAPKWNDMLFSTDGDTRGFGSQYWAWTMEPMYMPLFTAGASDLADPYFNMYVAQLPQCRIAATQRFNAKGAHFPEISPFDGPQTLPDDIAREYRDILLDNPDRKPLSARAGEFTAFDIPLIDFNGGRVMGHFTQTSHLFTSGPRIAQHAWWRYRHTGDQEFLRTHAYPLLRDCSEFYRSIVKREADGLYHVKESGLNDGFQGVRDGIADLAAIRGIVPLAIRSAEILKVDADLCSQWKDLLAHLAPFTMGSDPASKAYPGSVMADDVWSAGHQPAGGEYVCIRNNEDVCVYPIVPFEVYTLETPDKEMARIADKLMDVIPVHVALMGGTGLDTSARTPIAVSRVGRGEELPTMLCSYYAAFPQVVNGLSPFEGGAKSIEHLGINTMALQEGLLQSISGVPGQPEVIRVFPAWPKAWDATFSLSARGGFLVTSSIKNGGVAFVEIESERGEPCQIRNPWKAPCDLVDVEEKKTQRQSDDLIQFPTKAGHTYRLLRGEAPATIRIAPPPVTTPTSYAFTLKNGNKLEGTLGRPRNGP